MQCWGANALGQLGSGNNTASNTPVAVFGLQGGIGARGAAAGTNHSCALRGSGLGACWGRHDSRQLGDGTATARLVPTALAATTRRFSTLAAGGNHTCAVQVGDIIPLCWGDNRERQALSGSSESFINLSASGSAASGQIFTLNSVGGAVHGCELTARGAVACRGSNEHGRLGSSDASLKFTVNVGGITNATAVVTGGGQSCALQGNGQVRCWGLNSSGELGNGNQNSNVNASPTLVQGLNDAVSLSTPIHKYTHEVKSMRYGPGQGAKPQPGWNLARICNAAVARNARFHVCAFMNWGT